MQIKQDKYSLTQSKSISISGKGDDVRLDVTLQLNLKATPFNASISGEIIDSNNKPIEGAIIKLMDEALHPISHTITDNNGTYVINNIENNKTYSLAAIATGKLLNQIDPFTVNINENKIINFTLLNNPSINLGAISGTLTDDNDLNSKPLFGAIISLYNIDNNTSNLVAITYTDNSGSFVFSEVTPGNYTLTFTALGYISSKKNIIVSSTEIIAMDITLTTSSISSNGIVSGVITDTSNKKIADADVILYNVDENSVLTPLAFTTTNAFGVYTFINVPQGTYLVKSNQSQLITVSDS